MAKDPFWYYTIVPMALFTLQITGLYLAARLYEKIYSWFNKPIQYHGRITISSREWTEQAERHRQERIKQNHYKLISQGRK